VRVYCKPSLAFIWDYSATTSLATAGSSASLSLTVELSCASDTAAEGCEVVATLVGPQRLHAGDTCINASTSKVVASASLRHQSTCDAVDHAGRKLASFKVQMDVPQARVWSAEEPWLYTLVLSLRGEAARRRAGKEEGKESDVEACRIGFRSVRVAGNKLLVNEVPIYICGVNRHEHDRHRGKYCGLAEMVADIVLMKRYNINAVRTAHYPNRSLWYALCDAFGLYLVDEANIETHGLFLRLPEAVLANDPSWKQSYVDRGEHGCL
jgi:beta-galactosidase/beta-glucuronidase